jgi:hypothetical protein
MGRGEHEDTTTLIAASHAILAREQPTTVRRVVYELFNLKKITTTDKSAENRVSRLLTIARKDGRIPWAWIVDEHRRPERTLTFRDRDQAIRLVKERYRKDYWPTQPTMVTVWSEKSTVAGILAPALREYEVGFLAVHGNNSTSRIREASDTQIRDGRPWVILYIGDWDPSGCYMSDVDVPRRVREYGADIKVERVALLNTDVLSLPQHNFDVDDKRRAAVAKHGGNVGKRGIDNNKPWFVGRYGRGCMELDAMNSNDLRSRMETAIRGYIDSAAWEHMRLIEQAEMESINEILGRFNGEASPIVRQASE